MARVKATKSCKYGCGHDYAPKASATARKLHEDFCAQNPLNISNISKIGGEKVSDEYDECDECGYTKVPTTSKYCPNCGAELDD